MDSKPLARPSAIEDIVFIDARDNDITLGLINHRGAWRVYRTQPNGRRVLHVNWPVTAGHRFATRDKALEFLRERGYRPSDGQPKPAYIRLISNQLPGNGMVLFSDKEWTYKFGKKPPVVIRYLDKTFVFSIVNMHGEPRVPCLDYREVCFDLAIEKFSINEEPQVALNPKPSLDEEDDDEPAKPRRVVGIKGKTLSARPKPLAYDDDDDDDEEEDDF